MTKRQSPNEWLHPNKTNKRSQLILSLSKKKKKSDPHSTLRQFSHVWSNSFLCVSSSAVHISFRVFIHIFLSESPLIPFVSHIVPLPNKKINKENQCISHDKPLQTRRGHEFGDTSWDPLANQHPGKVYNISNWWRTRVAVIHVNTTQACFSE